MPPTAFDALTYPVDLSIQPISYDSIFPDAYEHYLKMHKVLVGNAGAEELLDIHRQLSFENQPKLLSAAGWAATEAALVRSDKTIQDRQQILRDGVECWQRALETQKIIDIVGPEELKEYAYTHRLALDIAIAPLLHEVIGGKVRQSTRKNVLQDCLNIAQSNAAHIGLASLENNYEALSAHSGFGYECNALLGFNLKFKKGWFILPSMARSDNGIYHRQQTHDLVVFHHRKGEVVNMTPVEIKAAASSRDRARYKALLVRGKMHLSVTGKYTPEETLRAIEAVYENSASEEDEKAVDSITDRFVEMIKDYTAGELLGQIATRRSVTRFRDNSLVVANHPGLAVTAAG